MAVQSRWVGILVAATLAESILSPLQADWVDVRIAGLSRLGVSFIFSVVAMTTLFVTGRNAVGHEVGGRDPRLHLWMGSTLVVVWSWALALAARDVFADNAGLIVLYLCAGMLVPVLAGGVTAARICVAWASVQAVVALLGTADAQRGFFSDDLQRMSGNFDNPLPLATALACVLPIAVGVFISKRRPLSAVPIFLIGAALLQTWTRGAILASAVGVGFVVLRSQPPPWVRLASVFVLLGFSLSPFIVRGADSKRMESQVRAAASRPAHWQVATRALVKEPLGYGLGAIHLAVPAKNSDGMEYTFYSLDPKNQLLANALTFGMLGIPLTIYCLLSAFRIVKSSAPSELCGFDGSLVALCVVSLTDSPFLVANHTVSTGLWGLVTAALFIQWRE